MKGKDQSKLTKWIAVGWVVLAFSASAVLHLNVPVWDIIFVGLFVYAGAGPIDLSIWLDKIARIAELRKVLKE